MCSVYSACCSYDMSIVDDVEIEEKIKESIELHKMNDKLNEERMEEDIALSISARFI